MIRPVTVLRNETPPRVRPGFVLTELVLVLAVPILGIIGLQSLLSSRAGVFSEEPTSIDPGYRAVVEPSPLTAFVEITDSRLTGVVVVAQPGANEPGGGLVLIPGELLVDDVALSSLPVEEAVAAVERTLHLRIPHVEVIDAARWATILGGALYEMNNPDPVPGPEGDVLFPVGPTDLTSDSIASLLGVAADDANPRSLLFRRTVVWQTLLDTPPASEDPVGLLINEVAAGTSRIVTLPLRDVGGSLLANEAEVEDLVRELVPLPAGSEQGDRLRVRLLDQVGDVDLLALARRLGSLGYEVVEVGNAGQFVAASEAKNRLLVPLGLEDPRVSLLADEVKADTLDSNEIDADVDGVVTLLVGEIS